MGGGGAKITFGVCNLQICLGISKKKEKKGKEEKGKEREGRGKEESAL